MPELPEVETIKRVIEPQIQGRMITKVAVRRPEVAAYPEADEFCRRLTGQTVSHMARQGKFLIIHLENKERIVLHLRMTGGLLLAPAQCPEEKYTHVVFSLDNGTELRFSDMRRFGRFWLLREEETDTCTGMDKLGLDPLAPACNAEYLSSHLSKRRKAIKECLLEQTIIAGIGNIYSDEILFTAGIYPARPANSLKNTPCRSDSGADLLFYREKRHNGGRISGDKGKGLPQYAVSAGIRAWRQSLSEMQGDAVPHGDRRQEQRVLSGVSKR